MGFGPRWGGLEGEKSDGGSLPARANRTSWQGRFGYLRMVLAGIGAAWALSIGGALYLGGCATLAKPNWRHPGTAQTQQLRAHQFDPYPESGLGPPVEGARPMEFLHPPPEIQRCRPHELRRRWFPWQPFVQ